MFNLKYLYRSAVIALPLMTLAACSSKEEPQSPVTDSAYISLVIDDGEQSRAGGYEAGSYWENFIDYQHNDYRVFFFNQSGKYIGKGLMARYPSTETSSMLVGKMPDGLKGNNFKIMVVANWGSYPEPAAGADIDEVCEHNSGLLTHKVRTDGSGNIFAIQPSEATHIPFYGIRDFVWNDNNYRYNATVGKTVYDVTAESISLLRALAKVEVLYPKSAGELSGISLYRFNEIYYAAPKGVRSMGHYDHNGDWNTDFVKELHLVGGSNQSTAKTMQLEMTGQDDQYYRWVTYVPEFRNDGTDHYHCYLSLRKKENNSFVYKQVYFAADPSKNANTYNIERNNIYRFTVGIADPFLVHLTVEPWVFGGKANLEFDEVLDIQ